MIKLLFVGDCYMQNYIRIQMDSIVASFFESCDYACCNLEGPLYTANVNSIEKRGPSLMQCKGALSEYIRLGFNVFALSNNHIMDFSDVALKHTITMIENSIGGVFHTGAALNYSDAYSSLIISTRERSKIGIINVAENGFGACVSADDVGYARIDGQRLNNRIRAISMQCDWCIVVCHCGAERFEYPLPEVCDLYRGFIDAGADAVIGHHPHVLQGVETYNNKPIFYSLGNYIWIRENESSYSSMITMLNLDTTLSWSVCPVTCSNGKITYSQSTGERIEKLSRDIENYDKYMDKIDSFVNQIYNEVYKYYYREMTSAPTYQNNLYRLKYIIKVILGKTKPFDDYMLYHNLAIETHRWICERACRNSMTVSQRFPRFAKDKECL